MSQDWDIFTDDLDQEPENSFMNPAPSSFHDAWKDDFPKNPNSLNPGNGPQIPNYNLMGQSNYNQNNYSFSQNRTLPESAPNSPFIFDNPHSPQHRSMQPSGINHLKLGDLKFYQVEFHPNHIHIFHCPKNLAIQPDDYVVTEADRGIDIGRVIIEIEHPSARDLRVANAIQRKATESEITQLQKKYRDEENAIKICQQKANELHLSMKIMGAEFQFDGKKLTFYYSASDYIDFRNLVKVLFKVFGTRIWMVWHDGVAPVRDVFQK